MGPASENLEARIAVLESQMIDVRSGIHSANEKLDDLVKAAAYGRGGFATLLRFGTIIAAIFGGFLWALEHVGKLFRP